MMGYKILVYWQITEEQKQKIREIADKHGCTTCFVTNLEEAKAEAADADIMFGSNPEPLHKAKKSEMVLHPLGRCESLSDGAGSSERKLSSVKFRRSLWCHDF